MHLGAAKVPWRTQHSERLCGLLQVCPATRSEDPMERHSWAANSSFEVEMAGAPGFEPGNGGTKNRCLTTWRRPKKVWRVHNRLKRGWQHRFAHGSITARKAR